MTQINMSYIIVMYHVHNTKIHAYTTSLLVVSLLEETMLDYHGNYNTLAY